VGGRRGLGRALNNVQGDGSGRGGLIFDVVGDDLHDDDAECLGEPGLGNGKNPRRALGGRVGADDDRIDDQVDAGDALLVGGGGLDEHLLADGDGSAVGGKDNLDRWASRCRSRWVAGYDGDQQQNPKNHQLENRPLFVHKAPPLRGTTPL
jgi:hypothetical protein